MIRIITILMLCLLLVGCEGNTCMSASDIQVCQDFCLQNKSMTYNNCVHYTGLVKCYCEEFVITK